MKRLAHVLAVASIFGASLLAGCAYPELATRLRKLPSQDNLEPAPPEDVRFIKFLSARIPHKMRDGRTWQEAQGKLPDPYAKLVINGTEVLRTDTQAGTIEPTWPGSPGGNFRLKRDDRLRVEIWDKNAINDTPLGVRELARPGEEERSMRTLQVELDGGGQATLAYEPARAMMGLGFWYQLRDGGVVISRLLEGGPAGRAGMKQGDQVVQIGGKDVTSMSDGEIKSAFNAVPRDGIAVVVKHEGGTTLSLTLAEGPVYPEFEQFGPIE